MILPRVIKVRHRLALSSNQAKIGPFAQQEQRRNIRSKTRFVKIDSQRVGQRQVPNATDRCRQRPHRSSTKAQRILVERVVAKYGPGPSNNRVSMNVRTIGKLEFLDQSLA